MSQEDLARSPKVQETITAFVEAHRVALENAKRSCNNLSYYITKVQNTNNENYSTYTAILYAVRELETHGPIVESTKVLLAELLADLNTNKPC